MVHGGRKCVIENNVERSVAASDSEKTMMNAVITPFS
jgi:hypothetical protein